MVLGMGLWWDYIHGLGMVSYNGIIRVYQYLYVYHRYMSGF